MNSIFNCHHKTLNLLKHKMIAKFSFQFFITWGFPVQKSPKGENGWGKGENNFLVGRIHGITLHPTNNVSNICIS